MQVYQKKNKIRYDNENASIQTEFPTLSHKNNLDITLQHYFYI